MQQEQRSQLDGPGEANGWPDGDAQIAPTETMFTCSVRLPHAPPLKLVVSSREAVADIKQSIVELPRTNEYTCFHLEFNGTALLDHTEIGEVEGLWTDAELELVLVEDAYTEREARSHLLRVRELLGLRPSTGGISCGISLFDSILPVDADAFPTQPPQPDPSKFIAPSSPPALLVKNLGLSAWNPPPAHLRLRGHLLYLTLTTLEGEQHQITCHVRGFYVNRFSSNKFDPLPRPSPKDHASHSLLSLIKAVSPLLVEKLEEKQKSVRDALATLPISNTIPASAWLVHPPIPTPDASRAQEAQLGTGIDVAENLRDWNEELQSTRELPRASIHDRILRERLLSKVLADFAAACVAGAAQIARGETVPINPNETFALHIYLQNNIFFSRALDGSDVFKADGGDEAVRSAVSKDILGLRNLQRADPEGLCTIATVVVDYLGQRILGQSILPGIFRQRQEGDSQIVYGGIDGRERIGCDPCFPPLLEKVRRLQHIKEHVVVEAGGTEKRLITSIDTKGLGGEDGRKYLLDLYRSTPLDVEFLRTAADYPHRMAMLRPELVEEFWRHRLRAWVRSEVDRRKEAGEEVENDSKVDISGFEFALNPDAFLTSLETQTPDEAEVEEASQFLSSLIIPNLVSDFETQTTGIPIDGAALATMMHRRGINLRYLGRIAEATESTKLQAARDVMVREMAARGVKHIANQRLLNIPFPLVAHVLANLLNRLFGLDACSLPDAELLRLYNIEAAALDLSVAGLQDALKEEIRRRFQFKLLEIPRGLDFLREVARKLGLQLKARVYHLEPAISNGSSKNETVHGFTAEDILNVVPIYKDAGWSSTLAEEALEAGRITVMQGQTDLGKELLLESLTLHEQIHGSIHPDIARPYSQLAQIYFSLEEKAAACELGQKAIIIAERTLGVDAADTILYYLNLSLYEHAVGQTQLALGHIQHALAFWKIAFQGHHPDMVTTLNNVAVMLQSLKQYPHSRMWFEESLRICERIYGKKSINCATIKYQLAQAMVLTQDTHAAVNSMRDAYNIFHAELGAEDKNTKETEQWLETLTYSAVNMAKHAKDLQARKSRLGDARMPISPIQPNAAPKPEQPTMDSRSIDELVSFIGGNESAALAPAAIKTAKVANPKRRNKKK